MAESDWTEPTVAGAPSRVGARLAVPALALLLLGAAAPEVRMTARVALTSDGATADATRPRGAFLSALGEAGVLTVDPSALAALRPEATAAELAGRIPSVDLLADVRIESTRLAAGVMGTRMLRFEASAVAQVVVAETGEVLGTITAEGQGLDVGAASAARIAAGHAAKALGVRVAAELPRLLARPSTIMLTVDGVPDADEAAHVAGAAGELTGVRGARVAQFEKGTAKIELRTVDASAGALARALDAARGAGVTVRTHTLRTIRARYAPARRIRLTMWVVPFENATGNAGEDWLGEALARIVATALDNEPTMRVEVRPGGPATLAGLGGWAKTQGAGASGALLVVGGRLTYADAGAALELSVVRADDGSVLTGAREAGSLRRFRGTAVAAARAAGRETVAKVVGTRSLRQLAGLVRPPRGADAATAPALVKSVDVGPTLSGSPIRASVTVGSDAALDGVVVELRDRDARLPSQRMRLPPIAAGETRTLDWDIPTDALKADSLDGPAHLTLEVVASHRGPEAWQTERVRVPAVVLPPALARWAGADQ